MNRPIRRPAGLPVFGILCLLTLWVMAGCHTTRVMKKSGPAGTASAPPPRTTEKVDSTMSLEEAVLTKLRAGGIRYQSFSARAKLDVQSETGSQNGIAVFLRMQKDSCIWISIRPVLGIELVRVLITPDSVKMINFFKKTLTLRSADSLQQLLHIPYDFSTLQDLLIGNPVMWGDSVTDFRTDSAETISFASVRGGLRSAYVFGKDYRLLENDLSMVDTSGARRASKEVFDEYMQTDGRDFSHRRSVLLETGSETTALIRFNHVTFDEVLSFPFPEVRDFTRN